MWACGVDEGGSGTCLLLQERLRRHQDVDLARQGPDHIHRLSDGRLGRDRDLLDRNLGHCIDGDRRRQPRGYGGDGTVRDDLARGLEDDLLSCCRESVRLCDRALGYLARHLGADGLGSDGEDVLLLRQGLQFRPDFVRRSHNLRLRFLRHTLRGGGQHLDDLRLGRHNGRCWSGDEGSTHRQSGGDQLSVR